MGGFEEDGGAIAVSGFLKFAFALAAFDGEEASEEERIGVEARADEGCEDCAWPRDEGVREAAFDAQAQKSVAWIGDAWHSGIGNEGDMFSGLEIEDEFGGAFGLVVGVVGDEGFRDAEMFEEDGGVPGVLGGDDVGGFECLDGPVGDVAEIAYGGCYEGEHGATSLR